MTNRAPKICALLVLCAAIAFILLRMLLPDTATMRTAAHDDVAAVVADHLPAALEFEAFDSWLEGGRHAGAEAGTVHLEEGVRLAKAREEVMSDLIRDDPVRALAAAVRNARVSSSFQRE